MEGTPPTTAEARSALEKRGFTKVVVDLPVGDQATAEVLWGFALGAHRYQLRSVPIWAYGLAFEDVVEGKIEADTRVHFTKVRQRSGLLTVRIAGPDAPQGVLAELV